MTEDRDRPPAPAKSSSNAGWGSLPTEASNPASEGLDTLATDDIVSLLLEEDRHGLETAHHNRDGIARAADWAAETLAAGGEILFAGAGTSGRLGVLEAAECPPTFGTEPDQIRAVIAGGPDAVFAAREGAEDIFEDGEKAASHLGAGDLLVAISASSVTPYVRGALASAGKSGARTVLVTCAARDGIEQAAGIVLALDTGPEVLTGSTRLKAGSATKAVLNAITTSAMVRIGKVYGNLMVDLRIGSAKLRDRALRIIETAGEVPRDTAERLFDEAGGEVKTAIVMALSGLEAETSRDQLRAAGGHVRHALAASPGGGKD